MVTRVSSKRQDTWQMRRLRKQKVRKNKKTLSEDFKDSSPADLFGWLGQVFRDAYVLFSLRNVQHELEIGEENH